MLRRLTSVIFWFGAWQCLLDPSLDSWEGDGLLGLPDSGISLWEKKITHLLHDSSTGIVRKFSDSVEEKFLGLMGCLL